MANRSNTDSNSDVFYPNEVDPKTSAPKPAVQGLEHILHSRGVRKPSQGTLRPGERPRPPSQTQPHRDRDPRDRAIDRPASNHRPPSPDNDPPPYNGTPRDYRPLESREPRPRDSDPPRYNRDDEPPRYLRDDEPPKPNRDYEPPRYSRDNDHPRREPPRYDIELRDEKPRDNSGSRPSSEHRSQEPYRPSSGPPRGKYTYLGVRVDKSTDHLMPKPKDIDSLEPLNKISEFEVEDKEPERETWGHKAEFMLATIGLAVGLGNVWRFPYLCQKNGGGAFLIPYVIFMLIEGLPLFCLELSIGQRMRKSAIMCWRDIHPCLFGIGVCSLLVSLMLCLYYIVVISWCCYYFFISFTSELPWQKEKLCHNWDAYNGILTALKACENNVNCTKNSTRYLTLKHNESTFPDCCVRDPSQYYFYHHALKISTGIDDLGVGMNTKLIGCLIFAWVITYLCIVKGIKSSGKVVYVTATFPYIILIIFFFRGVTLEGAGNGIKTFFTPKWELLLDANIWKDAATQMFFTLSLGFGALIAFASYMPLHNQVMSDAYILVLVNCGTSMLAGVVVFSILGYRELKTGIPADEVGSGPGLAFMTFSDAMLLMDVSPLWAILFFLMLILLGIDSEFGTLEATIGPIMDLKIFPKVRKEFLTLAVAVILFLFGLSMVSAPGFYVFQMFDDYSVMIPLLVIALFQCIGVAWVYGNNRFADDIEFMTGKRPWIGWMICWKYISPLALLVILIAVIGQQSQSAPTYSKLVGCIQKPFGDSAGSITWTEKAAYPGWGIFLVVAIVFVSTIPILIWLIKDWPKNWAQGFHKTFFNGVNNYLPDPKKEEEEEENRIISVFS